MDLSMKARFVVFNLSGASLVSLIVIATVFLFIGSSRDGLKSVFLFNSNMAFLLLPAFVLVFSVVWSLLAFNNFIEGKELTVVRCGSVGLLIGVLSYLCSTGAYSFIYVVQTSGITLSSTSIFLALWTSYSISGLFFFGILILGVSTGTALLWRQLTILSGGSMPTV